VTPAINEAAGGIVGSDRFLVPFLE